MSGPYKYSRFLLPGLFILILGVGNLFVGTFKTKQYEEVLNELGGSQASAVLFDSSPLYRLQLSRERFKAKGEFEGESSERLYHRRMKAQARIDFYRLVTFGGKVFVILSAVVIAVGSIFAYRYRSRPHYYRYPDPLRGQFATRQIRW